LIFLHIDSTGFKQDKIRDGGAYHGLISSFPESNKTSNNLEAFVNLNTQIRGSKGESTTLAGGDTQTNMIKTNRFGEENYNSSLLIRSDIPDNNKPNANGLLLSERLTNSQRNQEIMKLLKTGIFTERPLNATMNTI
jgi:hypothetical protein